MAAAAIRLPKPKMTVSAVQGRMLVFAEDGERIGQWGGTECFLSRQSSLGPCLVVRTSGHKRHEGTFFRLAGLQRVLSTHVAMGKLTVVVTHQRRTCSVFIETKEDLDALRMMAGVLQDKSRWADMERNVASRSGQQKRGRPSESSGVGSRGRVGLRDPVQDALSGAGAYDDDSMSDGDNDARHTFNNDANPPESDPASVSREMHDTLSQPAGGAAATTMSVVSSPSTPPVAAGTAPVVVGSAKRAFSSSAASTPDFTAEQRRAMQLLQAGQNVFVSGAAGTGKTEWLLYVLHHLLPTWKPQPSHAAAAGGGGRAEEGGEVLTGRVAATAATGIAARLIGGNTVHAFAGIGRGEGDTESILQRVQSRHEVVRAWQACEVLVIDEISMLSAHTFTLLDRIARVLRAPLPSRTSQRGHNASEPFGGLQLLVVGDFLQLPPVSRGAGEEVQPAFACPTWTACHFRSLVFQKDYRHAGDAAFAQCCADVRQGRYTAQVKAVVSACLNRQLDERFGVEATAVMARRKDVDKYNALRLQQLESAAFHRYASEDYAAIPGTDIDAEVSLPAVLTLKDGAQVVLLASLPDTPHLSNGEVGVVVGFVQQAHGPALPRVRFTTGLEAVVPAVTMDVYGRDGRLTLSRRQVPLQLAWALTVHRVQGLTLPMVRLALDRSFFEAGQAYVALSRVRRAEDLCLTAFDAEVIATVSQAAIELYGDGGGGGDAATSQADVKQEEKLSDTSSFSRQRPRGEVRLAPTPRSRALLLGGDDE